MLNITGIEKEYNGHYALRDINLHLQTGGIYCLIGPSGCGKSTLLRIIMGLITADSGSLTFMREKVQKENIQRLRHQVGYVIQEGGLFPHLTVRKNLILLVEYLRWDSTRIATRLDFLMDLTSLPGHLLNRYPLQLSGGERQRVSLMRALMPDPRLLLLDEPLGALDPMIRTELQEDLKTIFHSLQKTVLLVTHDINEAAFFSDQLILMRQGQVVQKGHINDLMENPADPFVTRYITAQRFSPQNSTGETR